MRSVLLVESHVDSRDAFATYLEAEGFRVDVARDTDDALLTVLSHDALVTCLHPKGTLSGFDLVRWVRAQSGGSSIAVIVVSASVYKTDILAAQAAGCDAFLPKPCAPSDLASELRHTIAARVRHDRRVPTGPGHE